VFRFFNVQDLAVIHPELRIKFKNGWQIVTKCFPYFDVHLAFSS
jgi:hypothetical protein